MTLEVFKDTWANTQNQFLLTTSIAKLKKLNLDIHYLNLQFSSKRTSSSFVPRSIIKGFVINSQHLHFYCIFFIMLHQNPEEEVIDDS